MVSKVSYARVEEQCDELLSVYERMKGHVKRFSMVVEQYEGMMQDSIMIETRAILEDIQADMEQINKEITKFTGQKQRGAEIMHAAEQQISGKVKKL